MKITALISSNDQIISLNELIKKVKQTGVDEIIVATNNKLKIKTVPKQKNRAADYNAAAKKATGDILVLIHQNTTKFPDDFKQQIINTIKNNNAGAFNIKFNHKHPVLSYVAFMSNNYRMRLRKIPYFDQTIFVKRDIFQQIGGVPEIPIFEDTEFSKKLSKLQFSKSIIETSAHRFTNNGILFHTLRNQYVKLLHFAKIDSETIRRIYQTSRK